MSVASFHIVVQLVRRAEGGIEPLGFETTTYLKSAPHTSEGHPRLDTHAHTSLTGLEPAIFPLGGGHLVH